MLLRLATALLAVAGVAACGSSLVVREGAPSSASRATPSCVAVLPFQNLSTEKNAGDLVAEELAAALLLTGRVPALPPGESRALLRAVGESEAAPASLTAAVAAGKALGSSAVVWGSVVELGSTTSAHGAKSPTVGYTAYLVDAGGQVLWSSLASNFHHAVFFDVPASRQRLVRELAQASAESLLEDHTTGATAYAPCTEAQARLARGELSIPPPGSPPPSRPLPQPAPLPTPPSPRPVREADAPIAPTPLGDATAAADFGPLPTETALDTAPSLETDALPAIDELPPMGGLPPLGELPGDLPAPPKEGGSELASAPHSAPPAALLNKLLANVSGKARNALRSIYAPTPLAVAGAFPDYRGKKLSLSPKVKKLLDAVAAAMRADPAMQVRLDVLTPARAGKEALLGDEQATLIDAYLRDKGVAAARLLVTPKAAAGGDTSKKANVLVVNVVRY